MNLLKDPILPLIIKLSAPAVLAVSFDVLYNVTGLYFAGLISTNAVAGMSMSFLLYMAIIGVGGGFGSALTALVGGALGSGRVKLAKIYAAKGVAFVFMLALFMGTIGFIFAPSLLVFLGANDEFLGDALAYLRVIFIAAPFFLAIKSINGVLVALGDTKSLRNWLFYGLFINAFLCYIFIVCLKFGVDYIALSTAIIQTLGTIFMAKKAIKSKILELNFSAFVPEIRVYSKILRQAIPSCLNHLSMSLGALVLLKFVSYYGTDAVAGYSVALRVEQIAGLATTGIASAVMSIAARNYGAKDYERVKKCYILALRVVFYYCLFACAFCVFIGVRFVELFSENLNAVIISKSFLLTISFAYFGYGAMNISSAVLQAIRRAFSVFLLNALRQIVLQTIIFSLIVFVFKGEILNLWLGMLLNVYFIAICFVFYTFYRILKFKKNN